MNLLYKYYINLMIAVAIVNRCYSEKTLRVLHGQEAKSLHWPWLALILTGIESWNICSGSLISDSWVLTAAHCVRTKDGNNPAKYKIVLGEHSRSKKEGTEVYSDVAEVHIFPKYEAQNHSYDMALVKLNTSVDFTKKPHLKAVCLKLSPENITQRKCFGAGWGRNGSRGNMPDVLQELEMKQLSFPDCAEVHNEWYEYGPSFEKVIDTHICMVSKTNRFPKSGSSYGGICAGDSGSPLQCLFEKTWWQIGVAWSNSNCEQNPSVFNRVDKYSRWIESTSGYKIPDHCLSQ